MTGAPQFFVLSREECAEVLGRNHVGRLAYREGEQVQIQPVGYVASDDWLFLRSAYGAKLDAITSDPFVAFEVDEIEGPFDWHSVVVHGTIYLRPTDGSPIEQREARRATEAIQSIMPDALTAKDPVPERHIIYGLHIHEMTGRMAQSTAAPTARQRVTPRSQPTVRKPSDSF
jgi:nitroimidazol reductase NimA-like FMN-containing flavoprotein (pyridoxamine 5'-phosphate oxidase superfamily)